MQYLIWISCFLFGCSLSPKPSEIFPSWTRLPAKTLDGDFLVFVESGDHLQAGQAQFISEGSALEDALNECSMIPVGTHIEDNYDHRVGELHQSYTKVVVDSAKCAQARLAYTTREIQNAADQNLAKRVRRFQVLQGYPDLSELRELPKDEVAYFKTRERIAQIKISALLNSPSAPLSTTISLADIESTLLELVSLLKKFEVEHPEIKNSSKGWSQIRRSLLRQEGLKPKAKRPASPTPTPLAPIIPDGLKPRKK